VSGLPNLPVVGPVLGPDLGPDLSGVLGSGGRQAGGGTGPIAQTLD
jgi:hypothetical protein